MIKRVDIWIAALLLSAVFFPKISTGQTNDEIRLVFAEDVINSVIYQNTTVAKGHVEFKHGKTRMFCDSALYFRDKNLLHAYSNVQINQGDTVNLFCDSLRFNGKTNISKLEGNVRFRDNEHLMLTDSLEYNGNQSVGIYRNWAKISRVNSNLQLTSRKGYYYSTSKTFFFKDSVHLSDDRYELFSDTLAFRTNTNQAHFHGPTVIYFDSSEVHCKKGIYFATEDRVQLWKGATFIEPQRFFYADSLLYNQTTDIGEGFCNVNLYDSTENVQFQSDYMLKLANNEKVILRDNAKIFQFGDPDTLILGGDTITYTMDTLTEFKTTVIENNVSIISDELFIRSDSAYFSEADSILKLHKDPIMWSQNTQLFADSVLTTYYANEFHEMKMYHNAMIISPHDSDTVHYDQIKGKFMTAYLDSSKIKKVHIEANAQTLYYPTETTKDTAGTELKQLSGMNRTDCNEIELRFLNSEIQTISLLDQPTSVFYPMDQIPEKELYFKGFRWEIDRKPQRLLVE